MPKWRIVVTPEAVVRLALALALGLTVGALLAACAATLDGPNGPLVGLRVDKQSVSNSSKPQVLFPPPPPVSASSAVN